MKAPNLYLSKVDSFQNCSTIAKMFCCRRLASQKYRLFRTFQNNKHCRNLITCSAKFAKLFQEKENNYAFTVLDKTSITHNHLLKMFPKSGVDNFNLSTLNGLLDVADVPVEELHNRFVLITSVIKNSELDMEDPCFNSLVEKLMTTIPEMTDGQIADILTALNYWPSTQSIRSPNFHALWNALDALCTSRCDMWPHEQMLKIAYLWFQLKFIRMTKYNVKMIAILGSKISNLSSQMVVHLLFFINLQRAAIPAKLAWEIENKLINDMEHLTLDELGVAALGFFKTQTHLKSDRLITAIISKIMADPDVISEMTFVSLLKLIRMNATFETLQPCRELQRAFISRVDNFHPSSLTHIVLLIAHHHVCDRDLLLKVTRRLSSDICSVRLKELAKSLYCLATFKSFTPSSIALCIDFANQVVDELRLNERQQEIEDYPASFVSIILSLAYMDIYPEDLINKCLGRDFGTVLHQSSKNVNCSRELNVIDTSVGIERPRYKGNRLQSSVNFKQSQYKTLGNHHDSHHDQMVRGIRENMMDIFGISEDNYFKICHILPHFQIPDILFILDGSGSVMPSPKKGKYPNGNIIRPNTKDKWIAIVGGGRSFYQRDSRQVTGASEMKLRQLKKLGYIVIEIPWFIYSSLHKGLKEKYLKKKIFERL